MATRSNVPQSALILYRLQSYRFDDSQSQQLQILPFPKQQTDSEAVAEFKRGLSWRSRIHLFVMQATQFWLPDPPDDDTESGPDAVTSRG